MGQSALSGLGGLLVRSEHIFSQTIGPQQPFHETRGRGMREQWLMPPACPNGAGSIQIFIGNQYLMLCVLHIMVQSFIRIGNHENSGYYLAASKNGLQTYNNLTSIHDTMGFASYEEDRAERQEMNSPPPPPSK